MKLADIFKPAPPRSQPVMALRAAAGPEADMVYGLRLASDILSRAGLARSAGKTFGGKRDFYEALGYARSLSVEDFRDRYERGDIAGRIVDTYPKETWAENGPELIEDEDPEVVTPWEQAFLDFVERVSLWQIVKRADTLSGLGPYSIILLGAAGRLEDELPRLASLESVLYLTPYAADDATINEWDANSASPRFGLPSTYKIKRQGAIASSSIDRVVHWSRVIHIADNLLDDRVSGRPLLGRCWNRLDDLDKVVGGGSEAFWLRVNGGTIFSVDKDVKVEDAQLTKLKDQAEEFAHGLRRTLAARGFTATQLDSDVSNFNNQVEAIVSLLSSATGIPQRILMGSERGELASSQDAKAWDKRIGERRTDFGEPVIKDFVKRLTDYGAMKAVKKFAIRWPEFEELDQTQKADVALKLAELNSKAGEVIITGAEIRDRVLRLPKLDEDALAEAEEKEEARREEERIVEEEKAERIRAQNPPAGDVEDE